MKSKVGLNMEEKDLIGRKLKKIIEGKPFYYTISKIDEYNKYYLRFYDRDNKLRQILWKDVSEII